MRFGSLIRLVLISSANLNNMSKKNATTINELTKIIDNVNKNMKLENGINL
jgi:hypothetical protein